MPPKTSVKKPLLSRKKVLPARKCAGGCGGAKSAVVKKKTTGKKTLQPKKKTPPAKKTPIGKKPVTKPKKDLLDKKPPVVETEIVPTTA